MAKYKVIKSFRDKETKEVYKADDVIEMTVKRANEVAENLKNRGVYLERIKEETKEEGE